MNRKPIFDVIRKLLGRGLRQNEVVAIDDAFISADGRLAVGPAAVSLIQRFEGCARQRSDGFIEAYPDPATGDAPWTIGWGTTGPDVRRDTVWTRAQCDARLVSDLERYGTEVAAAIGDAPTTQAQFDALVSFHYNTGAIRRATLTKLHCAGAYEAAAAEFSRWVHAGGTVMKGLVRRRNEEARLYRSA